MGVFLKVERPPRRFFIRTAVAGLLLLLAALSPVYGAERAWIDGALTISGEAIVGVGGVRLVQGETEIRADRLRYVDGEPVYFEGNVRVVQGESELTGEAFTYDLETSRGELTKASASLQVEAMSEPLLLLSERIQFGEGYTALDNVRLTTCTPAETAGYYLISRRMDIYPNDRIVIRNVRFVESGLTLFYWPYISISLKERASDRSRIRFPEVGYNAEDGWYAKLRYPYEGPGEGYGEAALDVMQHSGVGIGVSHTYSDEPGWEGSVTAYRLTRWNTGLSQLRLGWEQQVSLGDRTEAGLQAAYLGEPDGAGGEDREYRLALSFEHLGQSGSTRVDAGGQRYDGEKEGAALRLRLDHSARLFGWEWRLTGQRFNKEVTGEPTKDALEYRSLLQRTGEGYRLALTFEQDVHPSLLTESKLTPTWKSVTRLPEASIEYDLSRAVPALPFEVSAGYGRYEEVRTLGGAEITVRADRRSAGVRLLPRDLSLGRLGRLTLQGGAEWYGYSTGDRRLVLSADHQYRANLTDRWSLYGTYTYRQGLLGVTPFRFDSENDHERVSGRLLYSHPRGTFALSSGYDFLTGQATDVVMQLTVRSSAHSSIALQGGYSPTTGAPTYAAASLQWNPSAEMSIAASSRYSFEKEAFDRLAWEMAAAYLGWRLEVDTLYDGAESRLERGRVSLVRDLGCREIGFTYDGEEKAVWVEYRIDAMPGSGVRFGTGSDRFLFDSSAFSELFE